MSANFVIGGLLIAIAIALQFANLYEKPLQPLVERHPLAKLLLNRLFQLVAGFALLTLGIDMLR